MEFERMNLDVESAAGNLSRQSENEFYNAHSWCLNPILKLSDLLRRLGEEIDRYQTWPLEWQRAESRINFYLFAAAIACTLNDYIFWRPWEIDRILRLFPNFRSGASLLLTAASLPYEIVSRKRQRRGDEWKRESEELLEQACRLLLQEIGPESAEFTEFRDNFERLRRSDLPQEVLNRRMRLIEGYRRQDLTHYDVVAMARKFIELFPDRKRSVLVIGPRTAGIYFAPIVKVHLESMGFRQISWLSVRPKKGLFPNERSRLKELLRHDPEVIIVDDYSNSGLTFRLTQEFLVGLGVSPEEIILLAPIHPRRPVVRLTDNADTTVITLEHKELHKTTLLDPINANATLRKYLDSQDRFSLEIEADSHVDEINSLFEDHYKDSFQARLKRVYQCSLRSAHSPKVTKRVLAKSVGLGWLGYHAYIAANHLAGYVPKLIGLRDGILYSEWVEGRHMTHDDLSDGNVEKMGAYVARRASLLQIGEDPRFQKAEVASGWSEIISILRRPYGARTGFLKNNVLLGRLAGSLCPSPSMVDGRMSPLKWIVNGDTLTKVDFEHHNFGEPEFDVVDAAYDLAIASFEFSFSGAEEQKLIEAYSRETGDLAVRDRIFLFKLLHANYVRRMTLERILELADRDTMEGLNRRYLSSWNFLIYNMNAYSGGYLPRITDDEVKDRLFFMDLDDVFDTYVFGFPHTTASALKAIFMLSAGGFTIVPNTGRSVEHVSNYCSTYGFPYGVAEYGSVLVDRKNKKETAIISAAGLEQLRDCRSALSVSAGIFTDPGHHYSVRAYRFGRTGTQPLTHQEALGILSQHGFNKLTFIHRPDATYFVENDADKGAALKFVTDYLGRSLSETVAIGDSEVDVPMLTKAGSAYAPANCSAGIRALARGHECRITAKPEQRGLLEVAARLVQPELASEADRHLSEWRPGTLRDLMLSLMKAAEASRLQRAMALLRRNSL